MAGFQQHNGSDGTDVAVVDPVQLPISARVIERALRLQMAVRTLPQEMKIYSQAGRTGLL